MSKATQRRQDGRGTYQKIFGVPILPHAYRDPFWLSCASSAGLVNCVLYNWEARW